MSEKTDKLNQRDVNAKHKVHLHPPNPGQKAHGKMWIFQIFIWTFIISMSVNYSSTETLKHVPISVAVFIMIFVIFLNIFFDLIGVAVTAASEEPFHAIASRRVRSARYAVMLIRNAEKVANVCSDVIGDIAGILSGTMAVLIIGTIAEHFPYSELLLTLLVTGGVASLTVGGKAIGKTIAIANCNTIVFICAKIIMFCEDLLGINRKFNNKKKYPKGEKI